MTRIYVAGHRGMVGGAILRRLQLRAAAEPDITLIVRDRAQLDLTDPAAVRAFFSTVQPDIVILAAAKVGGILANSTYPAKFIHENMMIQSNVIHESWRAGVKRLLNLGSSCIYPKFTEQPISESALLTGTLEATNEPYAIAKIAGIKMCESYNREYGTDFRSVMPTNLYGPGDNFHPKNSHVLPAIIRRFHEAKEKNLDHVVIWGTGSPRREFLHVDDMAEAALHVLQLDKEVLSKETEPMLSHINVGTGKDISILDLARLVARVTGFEGEIKTDPTKPDGTPRKLLDVSRLARLGWRATISLEDGLASTHRWYVSQVGRVRGKESTSDDIA